jgi:glycosyltransferase involved in cell wall biosynthesis
MKILFAHADTSGCGFYRVLQPATYLRSILRHEVQIAFKFSSLQQLLYFDLIIIQRQYKDGLLRTISELQSHKKKIVYELDDSLWDMPYGDERRKYWTHDKIAGAEAIIKACDAVTTSTEPLSEILRQYNKNVFVIPNYVKEVTLLTKDDQVIGIGWAGSASHHVDFDRNVIKALKDIKNKYKDKVELVFFGWIPVELERHSTFFEPVPAARYLDFLNQLRLNIGIIPCVNDKFNECKSNLKFLEYSITKTASIASAVYPYVHTITEDTGILIKTGSSREWFEAIERLIEDADLRNRMANSAYEFVRNNYLIKTKVTEIEKVYKEILGL